MPAALSPVRLVPTPGAALHVDGLHHYVGPLEIASFADGLAVINRLPLERYLLGLQEVPTSWPLEALKAQAVAARTYALHTLATGSGGGAGVYGFDICATVQCQVFSGADVLLSPGGARWVTAVDATKGMTILYGGIPILARYHSTSGGRTLDNSLAFPDERDYPYLRSVESTTERGSPVYRWRVEFTRRRLQTILSRAGWWSRRVHGSLEEVYTVASATGPHYPDVVLRGSAQSLRRTAEDLRDMVRDWAPKLYPRLYPSAAPTLTGRLPETFPSNRLDVKTVGGRVRVMGRGWGHGAGMSQWGAHGLAARGSTYQEILAHYYTGVSIGSVDTSRPIEVGVATAQSKVTVEGSFQILDAAGQPLVPGALGTWTFRWAGTEAIQIDTPRGFGLPLRVGVVHAPALVHPGEVAHLTITLSKAARVRVVAGARGRSTSTKPSLEDPGRKRIEWRAPATPGTYRVRVTASTGGPLRQSKPVEITVAPPAPPPTESEGAAGADGSTVTGPTRTLAATALVLWLVVTVVMMVVAGRIAP